MEPFLRAFALLTGLALLLAACNGAGETRETSARPEQIAACVKDIPGEAVCTADLNRCGHPSACDCGPGYAYDPALGRCLLQFGEHAGQARSVPVADSDCVRPAAGACTRDINACGQPSRCSCEPGWRWTAAAGKCVRDLG